MLWGFGEELCHRSCSFRINQMRIKYRGLNDPFAARSIRNEVNLLCARSFGTEYF